MARIPEVTALGEIEEELATQQTLSDNQVIGNLLLSELDISRRRMKRQHKNYMS